MNLSPHFTLEEFLFSESAQRAGIENTPNDRELSNLKETANAMEGVRALLEVPLSVTSAFRSWRVNKLIGGADNSFHLTGLAVDFKPVGVNHFEAAKKIASSLILFDQLILEYGWIHIGFGPQMRRELLTKKSKDTPYLKGLVQ